MSHIRASGKFKAGDILRRVILSWLFACALQFAALPVDSCDLTDLGSIAHMSPLFTFAVTAAGALLFTALSFRFNTAAVERTGMLLCFAALAAMTLICSFSVPYLAACFLIFAVLAVYAVKGARTDYTPIEATVSGRIPAAVTAVMAVMFFLFVSVWTVCRVHTFSSPSFDFGIFSQMFHSMMTTGAPVTTIERDGPLSHLLVHMSPIYYLMLPFYAVLPFPSTLQVLQAAVIASSAIPFYLITKKRGLSGLERVLAVGVLLLYPTIAGGTSYDLHENCFLAPLIMWMLYAYEIKSIPLLSLFSVLTLTVKEDAAVYVAVIALYIAVSALVSDTDSEKTKLTGIMTGCVLLALSVVYFIFTTSLLSQLGDGVMTNRYSNFMYDGSDSLVTVVKSVFLSPMKAVFECMDAEKLGFIMITLAPLIGIPFFTRRFDRYILLIPYVLINLMSDYQYQHSIYFQYTFGSSVLLIYLFTVNLSDIMASSKSRNVRTVIAAACALLCAASFSVTVLPKAQLYIDRYIDGRSEYSQIHGLIKEVPDGVSVATTTFYTVPLSDRAVLYDIKYSSKEHVLSCEYMVLGLKDTSPFDKYKTAGCDGLEAFIGLIEVEGYTEVGGIDGVIAVYRKEP